MTGLVKVDEIQNRTGTTTLAKLENGSLTGVLSPQTGFRNRIINGDMRIDQRNNGASVTTSVLQSNVYTVDRWSYYNDVVSKRTIQRSSVAPAGFSHSLLVTVISTDTVGPQQHFRQSVEGFNAADFGWGTVNAQPATLSFWVRSSVVGQHGGALQNSVSNPSYPFAYTINTPNTWEYKTVSIAPETAGTWNTDNGVGITVIFEHGPGFNAAPAGSWVNSNSTTSTGSVNLCATNGATWYVTGVQIEKGTVATPFEFRSIGQELALCQRYFQIVPFGGTAVNTGEMSASGIFKVTMRTTPSLNSVLRDDTNYSGSNNRLVQFGLGGVSVGAGSSNSMGVNNFANILCTGLAAGAVYAGSTTASAEL